MAVHVSQSVLLIARHSQSSIPAALRCPKTWPALRRLQRGRRAGRAHREQRWRMKRNVYQVAGSGAGVLRRKHSLSGASVSCAEGIRSERAAVLVSGQAEL